MIQDETHAVRLEAVKRELSETKAELHQRHLALVEANERAAGVERHLQDTSDSLERKQAEIQVPL